MPGDDGEVGADEGALSEQHVPGAAVLEEAHVGKVGYAEIRKGASRRARESKLVFEDPLAGGVELVLQAEAP